MRRTLMPGPPLHAAIIMDGNGRWAQARGLPRIAGHRAGARAVRRTVEAAPALGIGTLTLFAFSSDNWSRPTAEVDALMRMFRTYLDQETAECAAKGVRVELLGRRDRLPAVVREAAAHAETATAAGTRLCLRLAVDFSGRDAILDAARRMRGKEVCSREAFARALAGGEERATPDVDLLVRTGGERRLSDFLLWESAYAELVFLDTMWPDFTGADLERSVGEFRRRERRFGRVPDAATG